MNETSKLNARQKLCYTTLALGYEYNLHAQQLAKDIERLSPGVPFLVLTDKPKLFCKFNHVIAIKHRPQSVGIFYDKLNCIEASIKDFEVCIFLDADCRLLKNMAVSRAWKPGITAKTCWSLESHLANRQHKSTYNAKRYNLIQEICRVYDIQLSQCKMVHECAFVVRNDEMNSIEEFVLAWKEIRDFLELNGFFSGEGAALGLAAHVCSIPIYHYDSGYPEESENHKTFDLFKDKLFYKLLKFNDPDAIPEDLHDHILSLHKERQRIADIPLPYKVYRKVARPIQKNMRFLSLRLKYMG